MVAVAWLGLGLVLLAAAALKAADRTGSAVALTVYGVPGRLAVPAWAIVVGLEAALAAGLAAGRTEAAYAAGLLLAGFLLVQVLALGRGAGGAPCGCFGARGRLSRASAGRSALLAGGCACLPLLGAGPGLPLAAAAAVAACVVVLALGRREAPAGALEIGGEGPRIGAASPLAAYLDPDGPALSLALFTSAGCSLCARVAPAADALAGRGLAVRRFDEVEAADAWIAADVPGAPFAVVLGAGGAVLAKGTVNDARQLESVVAAAQARSAAITGARAPVAAAEASHPAAEGSRRVPETGASSRRAFLSRAGGVAAGAAGAGVVGAVIRPGEAQAYHFCGHIYTTDGCPHPTGLPRIDRRGLPLRARDGRRVDDLGRLIDRRGRPVDERGALLADLDGRPLPPAPRTAVCRATARAYGITARTDGAWYRCCKGRVRKLVDCCAAHPKRINGDRALRGYCYDDRKVFCVMYFQSSVPC